MAGESGMSDNRSSVNHAGNVSYRPTDLSRERVGLTGISYGIMERAFEIALQYAALQYARERRQGDSRSANIN